ncbi:MULTISPECIES: DUF983 domain-containing protein [Spirosoma]|uniref:DUF983 domain-containing protein n=1 Tax=Spirosoma sordidisoli TaxID=2502893 RepID=A0A4Q2UI29_9BACT|nr:MULTISPECIES: DUF983 domain-containing protein [Spirosoma]RYC68202.1 DUF983 domain-containing protein [Spirosoma sordidisoli]
MVKGTKLYSIVFNKCPRCQQGDFFVTKSAFNIRNFDKMHTSCPVCGQNYTPEPGFYTGSMYVSYAFYVATIVSSFVLFVAMLGFDEIDLLIGLIPALIILTPLFFRLARRVWINMFVPYDPTAASHPHSVSGR